MNAASTSVKSNTPVDASRFYHVRTCPNCNSRGSVHRVQRRLIDRALSLFVSVQRYRCDAMGCDWEGNLPAERD